MDYTWWLSDKLLIELWPSPSEIGIDTNTPPNLYLKSLTHFYSSHKEIEKELRTKKIFMWWYTHVFIEDGREVARSEPPIIVEVLVWLGQAGLGSGLTVALYKILNAWIKKANGRKIKLKMGTLEIETTQLTEEQFEKLLQKIIDFRQHMKRIDDLDTSRLLEMAKNDFFEYQIRKRVEYRKEEYLLENLRGIADKKLRQENPQTEDEM